MSSHLRLASTLVVSLAVAALGGCSAPPGGEDIQAAELALSATGTVRLAVHYDVDADGVAQDDDASVAGWALEYGVPGGGMAFHDLTTGADGPALVAAPAGDYAFGLVGVPKPWRVVVPAVDQTERVTAGSSVTLGADGGYHVALAAGGEVETLHFGLLCLGAGGARTAYAWGHDPGVAAADLGALSALQLRDLQGLDFDPSTVATLQCWMNNVLGLNMAYRLSVELAAMKLNVLHGLVDPAALIETPTLRRADGRGYSTVQALMDVADASIAAQGSTTGGADRVAQGQLAALLAQANANATFVQASPAACALPDWQ
jgi:hypothetical protein